MPLLTGYGNKKKKRRNDDNLLGESEFGKTTRTIVQGAVLIEFGKLLKP